MQKPWSATAWRVRSASCPMTLVELVRRATFVLRCTGAATLAYLLAVALDLPHPVWAAMSGLIVSQERLAETRRAAAGRLVGTVVGIAIALLVGTLTAPLLDSLAARMALAVAVAAIVADRYPPLRVCMWTCPIIFLTADPGTPLLATGLHRGAEVFLGAVVGAVLHIAAELLVQSTEGRASPGVDE